METAQMHGGPPISREEWSSRPGKHMSNGLNLLHPRKDVVEMVIVFRVSLIVPKDLTFVTKSAKHVYQKSSFFVSPLSLLRVS